VERTGLLSAFRCFLVLAVVGDYHILFHGHSFISFGDRMYPWHTVLQITWKPYA
jgi:hypothetical protein